MFHIDLYIHFKFMFVYGNDEYLYKVKKYSSVVCWIIIILLLLLKSSCLCIHGCIFEISILFHYSTALVDAHTLIPQVL